MIEKPDCSKLSITHPCKNWSVLYGCCNRHINKLERLGFLTSIKLSEDDFDNICKGKSNINLCCWFVYTYSTIIDFERCIKREGKK